MVEKCGAAREDSAGGIDGGCRREFAARGEPAPASIIKDLEKCIAVRTAVHEMYTAHTAVESESDRTHGYFIDRLRCVRHLLRTSEATPQPETEPVDANAPDASRSRACSSCTLITMGTSSAFSSASITAWLISVVLPAAGGAVTQQGNTWLAPAVARWQYFAGAMALARFEYFRVYLWCASPTSPIHPPHLPRPPHLTRPLHHL